MKRHPVAASSAAGEMGAHCTMKTSAPASKTAATTSSSVTQLYRAISIPATSSKRLSAFK